MHETVKEFLKIYNNILQGYPQCWLSFTRFLLWGCRCKPQLKEGGSPMLGVSMGYMNSHSPYYMPMQLL